MNRSRRDSSNSGIWQDLALKSYCTNKEHKSWVPITVILIVATILRLYQISTESLWIDEMLSIRDALSLTDSQATSKPYVRPLFYVLLRGWMYLGQSDAWLRGLSVLFGLGTIYLTYELGRKLLSEEVGLISAVAMALAPLFINHAQEVRMYTLISYLSVLGCLSLSQVLLKPNYGWIGLWIISRIGLLLSNANGILILFPDFILVVCCFYNQRRQLFKLGISFLVIFSSFLPTFYRLTFGGATGKFMEQVSDYAKPGLLQVGGMITQLSVYYPLSYLLTKSEVSLSRENFTDSSLINTLFSAGSLSLIFYGIVTLLLSILLILSLPLIFKGDNQGKGIIPTIAENKFIWIFLWAVLPMLGMLAVSYLKKPIWFPRYLLFIAPYFLIMLSAGFMELWNWRRKLAIAFAIIYLTANLGGLKDYYTTLYRNDWQGLAKLIENQEQTGDQIFYYSIGGLYEQSLPRYYQGENPIHFITQSSTSTSLQDEPETIQKTLAKAPVESRLWLVCWVFCNDEAGIKEVFEVAFGPDFKLPVEEEFTSVEEAVRLKVYLATTEQDPNPIFGSD